ncbi:MAG: leucine-rich repeat domain-containing protein [Eubacteriales bacterium]
MKKRSRKLIALMIAGMMILSLAAAPAEEAAGASAEGLNYEPGTDAETGSVSWQAPEIRKDETGKWDYGVLEDGTAVITGFTIEGIELKIPDKVDGIQVTMVARAPLEKPDVSKMRAVKKVVLPNSIKAIEQQAFEFFSAMVSVNFPAGLETIGYAAFRECKSLKAITLPNSVVSIGDEAFSKCSSLQLEKLPVKLTSIGNGTFYQCGKIKIVSLPATVRSVGDQAFASCQITSLTLNEGLETIGENAFYYHKLKEIVFPSTLRSIGDTAFDPGRNRTLKKVTFKSAFTALGIGVFGYDDGWDAYYRTMQKQQKEAKREDYDTKDKNNWIDYYRDGGNFGQTKLEITCYSGSKADQMYQSSVVKVYLKGSDANTVTAPAERVLSAGLYSNDDMVYVLVIPEGVEEIADHAFEKLETLNKITLPSTLTRIGAHAFEGCIGLKEVAIKAKTMTEIGESAFKGCGELKAITVPEGVTEIADSTFAQCKKLEKADLPKGLTRIGNYAFMECEKLTTLKLSKGLETIGTEAFRKCAVRDLQIPDTVTSIGNKAFYYSGIKSLKLPAGMTEITDYLCAFSTKLNTVTLPKTIVRIGKAAFKWCPISALTLPEGLETIDEEAFAFDPDYEKKLYGRRKTDTKLVSVRFPASLKSIGAEAFTANTSLSTISFSSKAQLEEIGGNAFAYCFRLQAVTLPDSLRILGKNAFLQCKKMASAKIGSGIEEIGDAAFGDCLALRKLTVTGNPQTIGKLILNITYRPVTISCREGTNIFSYMKKWYPEQKIEIIK